jgi:hypothetical protein
VLPTPTIIYCLFYYGDIEFKGEEVSTLRSDWKKEEEELDPDPSFAKGNLASPEDAKEEMEDTPKRWSST